MDTEEIIRLATETGEIIEVAYHGGSKPGSMRRLAPISLDGKLVRARCFDSGRVKTFSIDKIEILKNNSQKPSKTWKEVDEPYSQYKTLDEFYTAEQASFEEMGWVIKMQEEYGILLLRKFKNGKPRKTPDVDISYNEFVSDWFYDDETGEEVEVNTRKSSRPWVVRAKNHNTSSYSDLKKAINKFVTIAESLAPNS